MDGTTSWTDEKVDKIKPDEDPWPILPWCYKKKSTPVLLGNCQFFFDVGS